MKRNLVSDGCILSIACPVVFMAIHTRLHERAQPLNRDPSTVTSEPTSRNTGTESFEQALSRLEEIVRKLDDPEVRIEESVELYQEGLRLSRICTERLETVSQKIEQIRALDSDRAEASSENRQTS